MRAALADLATPPGAPSDPRPCPPSPGALGAPVLHIRPDAPMPISLHRGLPFGGPIECTSPCDRPVDGRSGQPFYFAGDQIPRSESFHMTEKSGTVIAHVSPGSRSLQNAGTVFTTLGVLGLVTGAVMLPVGLATNSQPMPGMLESEKHSPSALALAGGVTLGVSAARHCIAGIVMNVMGRTRYDFTTASTATGMTPRLPEACPLGLGPGALGAPRGPPPNRTGTRRRRGSP